MHFRIPSIRRFFNRVQLLHRLQYSQNYWNLLQHLRLIRFWFNKNLFTINRWSQQKRSSALIFSKFIKLILNQLILVILLIFLLQVLDNLRLAQGWTISRLVPITFNMESESYLNALGTLAQLAGIFLGLYFTAVSVVASTFYAKVPGDVRDLFIRETGDNFYLRIVVNFILADVVIIILSASGFELGHITLFLITILGFLAILGFFSSGTTAFGLFDPSKLTSPLISDIWEWIQAVFPKGFKWQEPSIQEFYQRHTENALDTYYNVAQMANSADHPQLESLKRLSINALNLLQRYALIKPLIPSESLWYKRASQHRDWFTSEIIAVDLAMQTGTIIKPKMMPDIMWFEFHIEKIVLGSLKNLVDRRDYNRAYEIEIRIWRTLDVLAESLSIDEALHLFDTMKEIIIVQAHNAEMNLIKLGKNLDDSKLVLGLVDLYGLALIGILLGFCRRIRSINPESFGKSIAEINWTRSNEIYENAFPRPLVQLLEQIQKGIKLEVEIEGRIISPHWYQQQLAAQCLMSFFSRSIEKLVLGLESSFTKEADLLKEEKRYIVAAQLIQRGLEACSKFEANFIDVKPTFEGLSNFRKTDDIQWVVPEWKSINARINIIRENLIISFAKSLDSLVEIEPSSNYPDYFGQGFNLVSMECYRLCQKEMKTNSLDYIHFSSWPV